jgi:hypothetical protein
MKKITLLFIFISAFALLSDAQVYCGNFCVIGINNIDTIGINTLDVTIYNGDSHQVNYPTIVVTNSLGDTVANIEDYYYLFAHLPGDTLTQTIPTSLDSIPVEFTGTVYLTDRIDSTTCAFAYPMTCTTSGMQELATNNIITIYPNPASTTINISLSELKNRQAFFTMYDATGKKVKSFSSFNTENSIDRGNLPCGIYFITVLIGDKQLTKKIVLK